MVMSICSVLDWKYPFWDKHEIWHLDEFEYPEFDGNVEIFSFWSRNALFRANLV